MNHNSVISWNDVTVTEADEPVIIQECKDYMRLEGFVDLNDSSADTISDFDFDDALINDLIPAARTQIEQYCGISLKRKTIEAVVTNLCGRIEIPWGPVQSITSLKDSSGTAIATTGYKAVGNKWVFLVTPKYEDMTITYEAGFGEDFPLPKDLKTEILRLVTYMYMNRGDNAKGSVRMAITEPFKYQFAGKYNRKGWLA